MSKKKRSSVAEHRLEDENIHIGPSDYVAWQNDNKVCFLRMEGQLFGGVPMNLELRLSVEDSPNSAGVAIDMIRCAKLARDRGLGGPIHPASAYFCKHPPEQITDDEAYEGLGIIRGRETRRVLRRGHETAGCAATAGVLISRRHSGFIRLLLCLPGS